MEKSVTSSRQPNFGLSGALLLKYHEEKIGWDFMLNIIKSKQQQARFWTFIEELNQVRFKYNQILHNKFRILPRYLKKNVEVHELFKNAAVDIDPDSRPADGKDSNQPTIKEITSPEDENKFKEGVGQTRKTKG